uniref:Serpentine receptor class gamma n=1 Tax=Ascaris lumbricoides TaxID=6252 RepID=A0A0M3IT42_ASCLU
MGRILIGIGAGIGFITCTVLLYATTPYRYRPSAYFIFALLYSFALFLANLIPVIGLFKYSLMSLLTTLPAFIPGDIEIHNFKGILYLLIHISASSTDFVYVSENIFVMPQRPFAFCYLLMALNASIGVPLYQSFSSMIFTSLRISTQLAAYLSILYPILQLLLLFRMRNTTLTRRQLVIGDAYLLAVAFMLTLAVVTSIPCNTALCLISGRFHRSSFISA